MNYDTGENNEKDKPIKRTNLNLIEKARLAQIERAIAKAKASLKEDQKNVKIYVLIVAICVVFIAFNMMKIMDLPLWVMIILWTVLVLMALAVLGIDLNKYQAEIESNEAIKKIFTDFSEPTRGSDSHFEKLVQINVENLAAYYILVKTHTSQSFRVSVIVGIAGFLLLGIGLAIGFQSEDFSSISYISTGAGIVVEFISGVLFYLYNKTVRQLKNYHDSLVEVQNILLSFKLIEKTSDEKIKAEMMSKMIDFLMARKAKNSAET